MGSYRPRSCPNKDSQFCHHQKIFFRSQPFIMKSAQKTVDIILSYNINNQRKTIKTKKKRRRNIIWSKPSYSKSVKTNIERIFIKLICKHFPPNHKFVKIFNKNTIKLSYSCMRNIRSKTMRHNKKMLQPKPTEPQKLCNECPTNV